MPITSDVVCQVCGDADVVDTSSPKQEEQTGTQSFYCKRCTSAFMVNTGGDDQDMDYSKPFMTATTQMHDVLRVGVSNVVPVTRETPIPARAPEITRPVAAQQRNQPPRKENE